MSPEILSVLFVLGGTAAGSAATYWLNRTKTDNKSTPILDGLAELVSRLGGGPPALPAPAPLPGLVPTLPEPLKAILDLPAAVKRIEEKLDKALAPK